MSAAWAASSAGIVVIGVCSVLLWFAGNHAHRLPGAVHPWLYRALIFGMYVGGDAVAQTALGAYPEGLERWAVSPLGAAGGHDVLVIAGVVLLVATAAGLAFVPGPKEAIVAACLPFVARPVAAATSTVLADWLPVTQWSAGLSHWIGG